MPNIHTVHNSNGWQNKYENISMPIGTYNTKQEAQNAGKLLAQSKHCKHIIHGLNGRIQNKNSYGNDPFPPRDKK